MDFGIKKLVILEIGEKSDISTWVKFSFKVSQNS